jgi:hypothetical protein
MMRKTDITQWGVNHHWQNENQIEQDLLLSMAMVEVASDPLLSEELVLRGGADIPTFQPEELVATKLRALYQRKKGRDLYDLWLALAVLDLDPKAIVEAFPAYKPEGVDGKLMADNLAAKLADKAFCIDVDAMIKVGAPAYDVQEAGKMVTERLLRLIM